MLEAVYRVFNEGYTATTGRRWARAQLCQEAMRLGRMLAASAAEKPETHGLAAFMERGVPDPRPQRPDGETATLDKQDRARGTGC